MTAVLICPSANWSEGTSPGQGDNQELKMNFRNQLTLLCLGSLALWFTAFFMVGCSKPPETAMRETSPRETGAAEVQRSVGFEEIRLPEPIKYDSTDLGIQRPSLDLSLIHI